MSSEFVVKKYINCPQCGDAMPLYFSYAKIAQCNSCKSTIFIEDDSVRLAGESSVLSDEVSLIELNTPFIYENISYLPIGMVRYSYGRGFWEEWWLEDNNGGSFWLSVDEGDMILEQEVNKSYSVSSFNSLQLGKVVESRWIVTELGSAVCDGFVGSLPFIINKGDSYKYAHLSGKNAQLRTLEKRDNKIYIFDGIWIDSFKIERLV